MHCHNCLSHLGEEEIGHPVYCNGCYKILKAQRDQYAENWKNAARRYRTALDLAIKIKKRYSE